MELLVFFVMIVALLAVLDVAALKWGQNSRQTKLFRDGYDPREDWNRTSSWDELSSNFTNS